MNGPVTDPYEDLPQATFDAVTAVTAELVRACAQRDVDAIEMIVEPVFRVHGTEGRFATALALAIVMEQLLGLDEPRQQLVPGQRVQAQVSIPWDVVLFHPAGYDTRIASAAAFLSGYLSNQEPQLLAAFRRDGGSDTLCGLYELVSAMHNPPDRQQP